MKPWSVEAWIAFLEVCAEYAWPVLIGAVLFGYRESISQLVIRLKKISANGAEIHPPTSLQQSDAKKPDSLDLTQPDISDTQEVHLEPWLKKIREDVSGLGETNLSKLNGKLVLALADSQRATDFLYIYQLIYGSQIKLLQQLSTTNELSERSVFDNYYEHVRLASDAALRIEDWVAFVTAYKLAEGDRYTLKSTIIGNDFLQFLEGLNVTAESRIY